MRELLLVSDTRLRLRRPLAAAISMVLIGLAAGCSDDSGGNSDDDPSKSAPSDSATAPADPSETPTDPATDPNGPFVVAAAAVATRSIDQVIQLHVMGAGTVETSEISGQIPALASAIHRELSRQIADTTMMTPPKESAAARLVTTLTAYRHLAGQLSEWEVDSGPMPEAWFGRLERLDGTWKAVLGELSDLSGTDLLADVPELILPT